MDKTVDNSLEQQLKKVKSDIKFVIFCLVLVFIVFAIVILNTVVYFNVRVKQSSMEPTVYENDMLVANKLKTAKVGDVVIIENMEEYLLIKRVIAVEGQTVEIKNGAVYVDGSLLEETYLPNGVVTDTKGSVLSWTVGEGQVFFLGDNRAVSRDSRTMGTCKTTDIIGVVEPWSISTKGIRNFFYNIYASVAGFFGASVD